MQSILNMFTSFKAGSIAAKVLQISVTRTENFVVIISHTMVNRVSL